jgi:hypothetical protein
MVSRFFPHFYYVSELMFEKRALRNIEGCFCRMTEEKFTVAGEIDKLVT